MTKLIGFCMLVATLAAGAGYAAETPETLLIRQALSNDRFGHRRGDLDLALSSFAERCVVYEGNGSADPRAWSVVHEDRAAFAQDLGATLEARRYDIERAVPFILVREDKAIATTLDSGRVVDRQTGTSRPYKTRRLWTFLKVEEEWLATAFVQNLGDSLLAADSGSSAPEIEALLRREEEAWEEGSVGAIVGLMDEEFIGCDGKDTHAPASWTFLFSDAPELEKWLKKRLPNTTYQIDREVLHASVGKEGREALALTRETVTTTYTSGPAAHSRDRHVLWTLSRRTGSWKVTSMVCNLGLATD